MSREWPPWRRPWATTVLLGVSLAFPVLLCCWARAGSERRLTAAQRSAGGLAFSALQLGKDLL